MLSAFSDFFFQRISVQLGQFHGNVGCSCVVSGRKPLLNGCFPQHLFREEYLSGDTGGICVVFSLSDGIGTTFIRDDEKEGGIVGGVLSVCLSVPLVRKTILLPFPRVTPSLDNRGMTGTYIFPTKCHCPAGKCFLKCC